MRSDDSSDPLSSIAIVGDVPPVFTSDVTQIADSVALTSPSLVQLLLHTSVAMTIAVLPPPWLK